MPAAAKRRLMSNTPVLLNPVYAAITSYVSPLSRSPIT